MDIPFLIDNNYGICLRNPEFENLIGGFGKGKEHIIEGRGQSAKKWQYDHIQGKYGEFFVHHLHPDKITIPDCDYYAGGNSDWTDLHILGSDKAISVKTVSNNHLPDLNQNKWCKNINEASWVFQDIDPKDDDFFFGIYMQFSKKFVQCNLLVRMTMDKVVAKLKPMRVKSLTTKKALYYSDCI